MNDFEAAWVPERPTLSWEDAADIAVAWTRRQCAAQGRRGLLVTVAKDGLGSGPLEDFARRYEWTTPRSAYRTDVARGRPVLAYVPDEKTLAVAARYARGSSLCVVEGFGTRLSGWARAVGAVNLLGDGEPDPLDERLAGALERLHFVGNNGWSSGFGQDRAYDVLTTLADQGLLEREAVVGDMLARGHSPESVTRLGSLIDRIASGDTRPPRRRR